MSMALETGMKDGKRVFIHQIESDLYSQQKDPMAACSLVIVDLAYEATPRPRKKI